MATTDLTKKRAQSHGSAPDTYDRQLTSDDFSATASAAAAVITGPWIDAVSFRKVTAVATGASATLTVYVDCDHNGDGTVDETFAATLANPSVLTVRDLLTRSVRVRTVNGATIQNISGVMLLGD